MSIKPIDKTSIHRITSGQVVIDLQTAVKELVENSLDAGATTLEVRFRQHGLATVEVIDNGCGISEENYEGLAMKNHTSKLSSFADLATVRTFGFRGEALSSLCALCESVVVQTATRPPIGVTLEMDPSGNILQKGKVARQRGTTITLTNLFSPLPVRRKELERNAKREFGKALTLLNAYALGPCSSGNGVRLIVSNQADKGQKTVPIRTPGTSSLRESVSALWGPKSLDNVVDLELSFSVERDKLALKRAPDSDNGPIQVIVRGVASKFAVGCGRAGTDRQFFYVNGRPCNLSKVQKAFNEVYRSFNATQSPFIVADLILPTDACDINVSPDKRSILLHHETNLISALKTTLEASFASARSTYDVETPTMTQTLLSGLQSLRKRASVVSVVQSDDEDAQPPEVAPKVPETEVEKPRAAPQTSAPMTVSVIPATPAAKPKVSSSPLPTAISVPRVQSESPLRLSESSVQQAGESPFLVPEPVNARDERNSPSGGGISDMDDSDRLPPSSPMQTSEQSPSDDADMVVTLDASRAAWHRKVQLARKIPDEPESEPDCEAAQPLTLSGGGGYARKKRRSEVQESPRDDPIAQVERAPTGKTAAQAVAGHASGRQTTSASQALRTMLSGFSSVASQPRAGTQRAPPVAVEDEDELETTDDDEECRPASPPAKLSAGHRRDAGKEEVQMQVDTDHAPTNSRPAVRDSPSPTLDLQQTDIDVEFSSKPATNYHEDEVMIIEPDPGASNTKQPIVQSSSVIDLTDDDMFDSSDLSTIALETSISTTPSVEELVSRPEVMRSQDSGGDVSLRFELSKISDSWKRLREGLAIAATIRQRDDAALKVALDAGLASASDDVATDALARTINKEDFAAMEIVGQFNLGFVVTRRRTDEMDDLFIVDQHAADEKYNFETLQQTTRIKSQKLFRPQPLELTAGDELLALENVDVLRQNGFEIDMQAGTETDEEQGPRLSLTAQPVSKDTVFDMKDLEELIHLMHDQPAGQMVRCSKARAMFAMRACRKSVMIGMPLNRGQMTSVVRHMGTMDQPWNCPHGRPTMRHLADIFGEQEKKGGVDWSAFGC
ncbi:hypothetical protein C8R43DRAFT_351185 [Mycena crocata]|nr:hypothetical protein C8R43DRAFT_351185 [Mycena crocata]